MALHPAGSLRYGSSCVSGSVQSHLGGLCLVVIALFRGDMAVSRLLLRGLVAKMYQANYQANFSAYADEIHQANSSA